MMLSDAISWLNFNVVCNLANPSQFDYLLTILVWKSQITILLNRNFNKSSMNWGFCPPNTIPTKYEWLINYMLCKSIDKFYFPDLIYKRISD
jgi:hypothetical protein